MIETNISLKLPPSTKGLKLLYDNTTCIDPSFIAKLEIPVSSKQSLINKLKKVKVMANSNSTPLSLIKKVNWWNPPNIIS